MEDQLSYFECIKYYLELLYYLIAPFVAYFAYKALGQIKEIKKTRNISSLRDALKLSAEQCTNFEQHILPLINEIDKIIDEEKLVIFNEASYVIENNQIRPVFKFDKKEIDQGNKILYSKFIKILNKLELYSVLFVSNVADEKMAYLTTNKIVIDIVKKSFPILIPLLHDGGFKHLITLFIRWNKLKNKELTDKEKSILEEKVKELDQKSMEEQVFDFKTLGVDNVKKRKIFGRIKIYIINKL